ncbi:uncharacterized protein PGTG_13783 [Puccinia graminis f. sp. tritici CRL 75-36-700-3]|uniref:Uncharacterized protein n=1 Tax=Puccinia graminis f. sp. tritici (strain CRL 75-36-700-3 / race SCCL) TaxID=418459 RepID=E3KUM9_PUCGT|nr:uncharacterized protein PGTG_13783 [Puccinia graminis f. sp. tritici CRL 75-36-700-3]EFP87979.1 hypothetical protein PGTG_13783 [Puccinia graminis f. sp. tritici CRL 75-36-700-3]
MRPMSQRLWKNDQENEEDPSDGIGDLCENIFTKEDHLEEDTNPQTVLKFSPHPQSDRAKKPLSIRPIKLVKQKPEPITASKADEPGETSLSVALSWSTHYTQQCGLEIVCSDLGTCLYLGTKYHTWHLLAGAGWGSPLSLEPPTKSYSF